MSANVANRVASLRWYSARDIGKSDTRKEATGERDTSGGRGETARKPIWRPSGGTQRLGMNWGATRASRREQPQEQSWRHRRLTNLTCKLNNLVSLAGVQPYHLRSVVCALEMG